MNNIYRKKPVDIEAFEIRKDGPTPVPDWFGEALSNGTAWPSTGEKFYFTIKTLEGVVTAQLGDYIIKGVNGELYPCKPDIFKKTYYHIVSREDLLAILHWDEDPEEDGPLSDLIETHDGKWVNLNDGTYSFEWDVIE